MINGIVMFSGGLDSVCATHLLLSQGLRLQGLYFSLPFYTGFGMSYASVQAAADKLQLPLRIIEEGEEYLAVVKSPIFGFGRNANPCVDCRIHRLGIAKKIMEDLGASFIATGEVVGQRPMSQRRDCLHTIENRAGIKGRLLRPLSAKTLPETIPEADGLVDREKLLSISGRGRKEQIAYAKQHGLVHGTPAGGCFLTEKIAAFRLQDLSAHVPDFSLDDFRLLAFGRHFRLSPTTKLVIGRDDAENRLLEKMASPADFVMYMADDKPGPVAVLRGDASLVPLAASVIARYSRFHEHCRVAYKHDEQESIIEVAALSREQSDSWKIRTD
ncbi:MAG: hypothetical protein MUF22_08425 [Chitinispirillaceae bacterium]|jgi:hypothetical protein|nr:hypothetical protein [Chitinispirillaceae bacterium]